MRRTTIVVAAAVTLLLAPAVFGQHAKPRAASAAAIARGKYLVNNIGMCNDCHTPHNEKGEFLSEQLLQGTLLPFKPIVPMPVWAEKSVNIAGLPGWEKDAAIKFFMTGIAYNGLPARPPMPQYRFTQQDAESIVAYLTSLAPQKK